MKTLSAIALVFLDAALVWQLAAQTPELADLGECGRETCLQYRGQQNSAAANARLGAAVACRDFDPASEAWTVLAGAPGSLAMGEVFLIDPLGAVVSNFPVCGAGTTDSAFGAKVAFSGKIDADAGSTWGVLAGNPAAQNVFVCSEASGEWSSATSAAGLYSPSSANSSGAFCDLGDIGRYNQTSSSFEADRDGVHEILIGSPGGGGDMGQLEIVSIYLNGGLTEASIPIHTYGDALGDELGTTVLCLPDLDEDGLPEFAAGAPFHSDTPGAQVGQVKLYSVKYGSGFLETNAVFSMPGLTPQALLGRSLARAGDLNLDGNEDILIGLRDSLLNGKVAIFSGPDLMFPHSVTPLCEISMPGDESFGKTLAGLGDADGDGKGEFVVGAPGANSGAGMLYFYEYDPSAVGSKCVQVASLAGPLAGYRLGTSLATCKILGNDSLPDLVVGTERNLEQPAAGSVAFFAMVTPTPPSVGPSPQPTSSGGPEPTPQPTPQPVIVPPPDQAKRGDLKDIDLPPVELAPPGGGEIQNRVTVFLPDLIDLEEQGFILLSDLRSLAKAQGAKSFYRYQIKLRGLRANGRRDVRRRTTKRNSITFSRLRKGDYNIRYRLQLVRKGKVLAQSSYSPAKSFSPSGRSKS